MTCHELALTRLSLFPSVAHGPGRNVVDTAFGDEAHLVVWGHEHDCIERATPQEVTGRPYYIVQPGSSIATSLAKGESIPKSVNRGHERGVLVTCTGLFG